MRAFWSRWIVYLRDVRFNSTLFAWGLFSLPTAYCKWKGTYLLIWALWKWVNLPKHWTFPLRQTLHWAPLWQHLQGTSKLAEAIYHFSRPSYGTVNASVIAVSGEGPFIGVMNGARRLSAQKPLPFVSANVLNKTSAWYSLHLTPILRCTSRKASGWSPRLFDLSRCHLWLSGFTTWADGQKSPCKKS